MKISRRMFLQTAGLAAGSALTQDIKPVHARKPKAPPDAYGCLFDITKCVGCRKCEQSCKEANNLPEPEISFEDTLVFEQKRRPINELYTVVNRYYTGRVDERNQPIPSFVKLNCMHCQDPGCVSACIVGALTKKENGVVHYDVSKCIGCRYCMIACPFQIPTYEYEKPFTPRIHKCSLCCDRILKNGGRPACAAICPVGAISFGKRKSVVKLAHQKIMENPGKYVNYVYGEREVGGTSWVYISGEPFNKLGFLDLPSRPIPHLAESIQHTLFKNLWSPITLFALLGGSMWIIQNSKNNNHQIDHGKEKSDESSS